MSGLYVSGSLRLQMNSILYKPDASYIELSEKEASLMKYKIDHAECWSKNELEAIFTGDKIRKLVEGGFLGFQQNSSRVVRPFVGNKGQNLSAPLAAHFYPFYQCNQNCFFCYNQDKTKKEKITKTNLKNIERMMDKLYDAGVVVFNYLGGEPLLERQLLLDTFAYGRDRFFLSFATNGTGDGGITTEYAKKLAEFHNLEIRFSIEGCCERTNNLITGQRGGFKDAIASAQSAITEGISCRWSCMPSKMNITEIEEMIIYAKKIGMVGFHLLNPHINNVYGPWRKEWIFADEKRKLLSQLRVYKEKYEDSAFEISYSDWETRLINMNESMCSAVEEMIEIGPDGNCYPCSMVLGRPEWCLGNVFFDDISDILQKREELFEKRNLEEVRMRNHNCGDCIYLDRCLGGCPFTNFLLRGDMLRSNHKCTSQCAI